MLNTVTYFALSNVKEHSVQNFLRKEYQNKILQANGEKILELDRIRTRKSAFPKIEEGLKQFVKDRTFQNAIRTIQLLLPQLKSNFNDKAKCYHPWIR